MVDLKSNILVITLHIYGISVSIRRQRSWKLSLENRTICYLQDTHEINIQILKSWKQNGQKFYTTHTLMKAGIAILE